MANYTDAELNRMLGAHSNDEMRASLRKQLAMAETAEVSNRPKDLPYQAAYDPKTMTLSGRNQLDSRGLDAFQNEALRSGPSKWANRMGDQQNLATLNAREGATRQVQGQNALAMSTLASRGGLSSGARERVTREGAKENLLASQDIGRQNQMNMSQIGINDEQNRISQLGSIPGMQLAKTSMLNDVSKYDITNQLNENNYKNLFNMEQNKSEKAMYGAKMTADAQRASKGGSFFCTEMNRQGLLSPRESVSMTKLMVKNLLNGAAFFVWYFKHGQALVDAAKARGFDWKGLKFMLVEDVLVWNKIHGSLAAGKKYIEKISFVNDLLGRPCGPMPENVTVVWHWPSVLKLVASGQIFKFVLLARKLGVLGEVLHTRRELVRG